MALPRWGWLGALFGRGAGGAGQEGEVAVATFGLVDVNWNLGGKLAVGSELLLGSPEGRVAVMNREGPVGYVPEREAVHVGKLMEQGARLGCRVVFVDPNQTLVRVRVSILM